MVPGGAHHPAFVAATSVAAALAALHLSASSSGAQQASPPACTDSDAAMLRIEGLPDRAAPLPGTAVDTTFEIAVDRGSWTWRNPATRAAAGSSGIHPANWHACADAWFRARGATITIENARGTAHVRASIEPRIEVLRRHRVPARESKPLREDR